MLSEEEYVKRNCKHISLKTACKMYKQYVDIENTVNCYKVAEKQPWPTKPSEAPKLCNAFEFATIATTTASVPACYPWAMECPKAVNKQEVENTMTDSEVSRNYLTVRLDNASRAKRNEFTTLFNLYANPQPKSYKDLIDWIKNDKFTLDAKMTKRIDNAIASDDEGTYYGEFFDGIIWTGAAKVPDQAGYEAAEKVRAQKTTAVKDVIYTSDAPTALKALQDFEAWMPTTVAN